MVFCNFLAFFLLFIIRFES